MVELVDTRDLKSLGHRLCRFKPGSGYQDKKAVADLSATAFRVPQMSSSGRTYLLPRALSPSGHDAPGIRQTQGRPLASIRDGLEDALHPAGAAMQMQDAGKAVPHLQHGFVPQGQSGTP